MLHRISFGTVALTGALVLSIAGAAAHDESRYPDWKGQWRRAPGVGINWDETKPRLKQEAPLIPEYQAIWEASVADQAAGGQGGDTRVKCISNGMPRLMTVVRPIEFFVLPKITLVVYENNIPRRIYTDGRDFSAKDNLPSYAGYSIGKWIDEDGDGRYDTLEVETRNFKGPRNYEPSGIPLHADNQSVIKERLHLDKSNNDVLKNEITVLDHALTRPWTVVKNYRRERDVEWYEDLCSENNNHVVIGKENYFLSGDGYLMPAKKDQQPPDLRYFKQTRK